MRDAVSLRHALFAPVLTFGLVATLAVLDLPGVAALAVVGWFLLTPLLFYLALTGDDDPGRDPVAELRARYARGEVTHAEFERRLDRLLATEDEVVEPTRERERNRGREPVTE